MIPLHHTIQDIEETLVAFSSIRAFKKMEPIKKLSAVLAATMGE
jgi:hypothetical protein